MRLTQDKLKDLFSYEDGKLYWKPIPDWHVIMHSKREELDKRVGQEALNNGSGAKGGYFNFRRLNRARVIFLMHHGEIPPRLKRIDRDLSNDRIENLVYPDGYIRSGNLYHVNTPVPLGGFDSAVKAHDAYLASLRELNYIKDYL